MYISNRHKYNNSYNNNDVIVTVSLHIDVELYTHFPKPVEHVRSSGKFRPWHSQNSLFKHFQEYLGIFGDIDVYSPHSQARNLGAVEVSTELF